MDLATGFENINWLSVLVATISLFFIGGIWYGPLFGKSWMIEFDLTIEDLKKRNVPKTFGLSFLLAFISSLVLELFLGKEATPIFGTMAGFFAGLGWVATFLGIIYLFEMRTMKAFLINAGYCIVSLTLAGTILGTW